MYLIAANILDSMQSGWRPAHWTKFALVVLMDDVLRSLDGGLASIIILLDLSAAFDTTDHVDIAVLPEKCGRSLGQYTNLV